MHNWLDSRNPGCDSARTFSTDFAYPCLPAAYPNTPSNTAPVSTMPSEKLTKTAVDRLKPAKTDYIAWDDGIPGFGIRVKPTGVKSALIQYRNRRTGASRRKTLGQLGPLLSLHQARDHARLLLSEVIRGEDPAQRDKAYRAAPTISDLAEDYLARHAIPKKRPRSVANDRGMIARIILPTIGTRKVQAVGRRDIEQLHNGLRATPYQANRVLSLLSKMFSLAISWGWRTDNPAKGLQRFAEARRERWLSEEELSRLIAVLNMHPNQRAATAIRLQILTGARIGEVLQARWRDFDFERGVWIKPSHHTKQKRTEYLPLAGPTLAMLMDMRQSAAPRAIYLFPGDAKGKPLQDLKRFWRDVLEKAELADYRRHDNRHTHASYLVSNGLSLEIVGRLLGHTSPLTTRRYAHLADSPLRAAANQFGDMVQMLSGPAAVES